MPVPSYRHQLFHTDTCRAALQWTQPWPTELAREIWASALTVSACYKLR
jgi:hypothetical protein